MTQRYHILRLAFTSNPANYRIIATNLTSAEASQQLLLLNTKRKDEKDAYYIATTTLEPYTKEHIYT